MQNDGKKAGKSPLRANFRKISKILRIYLHYSAYSDIILHISKDITSCS